MKLGFISSDFIIDKQTGIAHPGGCAYYRGILPFSRLEANGWDVSIGQHVAIDPKGWICPATADDEIEHDCDIVVLQRWMHKDAPAAIKRARAAGQIILNDVDDLFLELMPDNQAFHTTHPKTHPESNRNHYHRALRAGDGIICSTPYLAQRYGNHNTTWVIRNRVDLSRDWWQPEETGSCAVGWVGSTAWRSGDLEILRPALPDFMKDHSEVEFIHAGANPESPPAWELIGLPVERCGYLHTRSVLENTGLFAHMDIGVAPLSRTPFNKSKSNLKILEYSASGIPAVCTGSDEYKLFGAGIMVNHPSEWRPAFERLLNPGERAQVRGEQYAAVKKWDIDLHWQEWNDLFITLLTRSNAGKAVSYSLPT